MVILISKYRIIFYMVGEVFCFFICAMAVLLFAIPGTRMAKCKTEFTYFALIEPTINPLRAN